MFIHLIFKLTASKKLFTRVLFSLFSILFCLDAFPYTANGQIWRDSVTGIDFQLIDRNSGTSYTEASIFRQGALDCGTPKNCVIPATVTYNGNVYPVTDIGPNALQQQSIVSVTLPDSLTTIGRFAFYQDDLRSVTIPDSVTTIGHNAFDGNLNLASLVLGSSLQVILQEAFKGASLASLTIPDSLTSIGDGAFRDNRLLTSLTIGNSVTSIGDMAFRGNTLLTSLTIGNSVTSIGQYAFYQDDLRSVTIPDSVTTIGLAAFKGNALLSVRFEGNYSSNFDQQAFFTGNATLANIYAYNGTTGWSGKTFFYDGLPTQKSRAVTLVAPPPGAPTGLSAVAGDGNAVISFTAGSANGGTISNYQYSIDAGSTYTALSPTVAVSPITIAPLTNGVTYSILLKAVNSGGLASTASAAVSVTPAVPTVSAAAPTPTAEEIAVQIAVQAEKDKNKEASKSVIDDVAKIDLASLDDPASVRQVDDVVNKVSDVLENISSGQYKDSYTDTEKKDAVELGIDVLKIKMNVSAASQSSGNTPINTETTPPSQQEIENINSTVNLISDITEVLVELPSYDSSVKEIAENLIDNVIDTIFPVVNVAGHSADESTLKSSDALVEKFLDIQESVTTNISLSGGKLYIPSVFQKSDNKVNAITKKRNNVKAVKMSKRKGIRKRAKYRDVIDMLLAEPVAKQDADPLRTIRSLGNNEILTVGVTTESLFNSIAGFDGVDHNDVHSDFYFGNKVISANIVSINYSIDTPAKAFEFNEDGSLEVKLDANTTATMYPAFYNIYEIGMAIRNDFASYVTVSEQNIVHIIKGSDSYYAKATFSPFKLNKDSSTAKVDPQFSIVDGVFTITYGDTTVQKLVPHFNPVLFDYLTSQDHAHKYHRKTGSIMIDGKDYLPDYAVEPLENFDDKLYWGSNRDERYRYALESAYIDQDNKIDLYVYTAEGKQAFIAQQ